VIVHLGATCRLRRLEIDTSHFKGNYPDSCSLDASPQDDAPWLPVLDQTKLAPDTVHVFDRQLYDVGPMSRVRLNIFPDGGVSRLRVWGKRA
jgi:allantoicase